MDLLVIAGSFPPKRTARSLQNGKLFSECSIKASLFVPKMQPIRDHQVEISFPKNITLRRIWDPELYYFHGICEKLGLPIQSLPDRMWFWSLLTGLACALATPKKAIIYSISHPLSSHVAGWIAKTFRYRESRWLAFFSDPWTDWGDVEFQKQSKLVRALNHFIEKCVLKKIDVLIFPSEGMAKHFQQLHSFTNKPVELLPQSFDPRLYPPRIRVSGSKILIRYVGDFYKIRSPKLFLQTLYEISQKDPNLLKRFEVEFYGRWGERADPEISSLMQSLSGVRYQGSVPFETAGRLMSEADLLLHIGVTTKTNYFRPSKLIDYLGANAPILGFCAVGEESDFIAKTNGFFCDIHEPAKLHSLLTQIVELKDNGGLYLRIAAEDFRLEFSIDRIVKKFEEIISKYSNF